MSAITVFGAIFVALFGAIVVGAWLRSRVPQQHLAAETKDAVMLAMGLVSTMAALLLGLLVSGASETYDEASKTVGDLSAKVINIDSTLELYGPESARARADVRTATEDVVRHIWAEKSDPTARLAPRLSTGDQAYTSIMSLKPANEMQTSLKEEAIRNMYDAFEISSDLYTKSQPSISPFLLAVVVGWLGVIFISYSVFSPHNTMSVVAMLASALSVFGALVLIWELDRPFDGFMKVSAESMRIAIAGAGEKDKLPAPAAADLP